MSMFDGIEKAGSDKATPKQIEYIQELAHKAGNSEAVWETEGPLSRERASELIDELIDEDFEDYDAHENWGDR